MTLEFSEIFSGISCLIYVLFSIFVGLRICSNYFQRKDVNFILVGISWIFMVEPWMAVSTSFLLYVFTGKCLTLELYLIIGYFFIPCGMIIWIIAITNFLYKDKQKIIIISISIIEALFIIFFLYFLINNISLIGDLSGPVDLRYGLFLLVLVITHLILILITGTLFALEPLKSENPELRLKGKIIFIAIYSLLIGAVLSIFSPFSFAILIIARIISISSAIEFYYAFIKIKA